MTILPVTMNIGPTKANQVFRLNIINCMLMPQITAQKQRNSLLTTLRPYYPTCLRGKIHVLTILLISILQFCHKIWWNNRNELQRGMSHFVFHRSNHCRSPAMLIPTSRKNRKKSGKIQNKIFWTPRSDSVTRCLFSSPNTLVDNFQRDMAPDPQSFREAEHVIETVASRIKAAEYGKHNSIWAYDLVHHDAITR